MNEPAGLNIDVELEELEYRLERLRALYEQYFLGIEKLEPTIPRKDVDRRIWMLRREKMRNTGKKFKLQVLVQRYNTFQQYWARICREIENGTYKRHLLKAEKILAEAAPPKKKLREKEEGKPQRAGAVQDAESEIAAALASGTDLGGEDLDELLGLRTPTGMRSSVRPSAAPGANRGSSVPAGRSSAPKSKYELQRLDLNIDDLIGGGAAPIGARPATAAPAARPARSAPPPADAPPASAKAPPPVGPMAGARPRMPRGAAPPAPPPAGPPRSQPHHPPPVPPRDAPPQSVRPARTGGPPPIPSRRPGPPPVPSRAPAAPPPPAAGAPPPPAAARPPPGRPAPPPAGGPPSARPPAAHRPPPGPPPAARPNRPPAAGGGLSDDRVRELHARLTDAKRQVNDGKSVSMDGLARQLRAAEQDLRKRHGNRKIDFDVVIRDGKAVVKPKVK